MPEFKASESKSGSNPSHLVTNLVPCQGHASTPRAQATRVRFSKSSVVEMYLTVSISLGDFVLV